MALFSNLKRKFRFRMDTRLAISDHVSGAMVLTACRLQIVLGTALAWTHLPHCDEGFYGVPAHVLSVVGALRNRVLESAGVEYLRGVDQSFYWMVPMGMVLQAGAFKVFGFGLLVQRELSVVCGLGAVVLWYLALRHLVADRVAALASMLLSVDYVFLSLSSLGRSDMISLFFAMAALAGYMHWRERSPALALAIANTACALSGMVHPNGGIAAVVTVPGSVNAGLKTAKFIPSHTELRKMTPLYPHFLMNSQRYWLGCNQLRQPEAKPAASTHRQAVRGMKCRFSFG